jgi:hypothetical protein
MVLRTSFKKGEDCLEYLFGNSAFDPAVYLPFGNDIPQLIDGEWAYHDSCVGESDFSGQEAVYHHQQVVWAMNYFGRIINPARLTS